VKIPERSFLTEANAIALPRIETSLRRLERAVGKLEASLSIAPNADMFLADDLRRAKAEYRALEEVTRSVSDRLDATIDRLKAVLEE